MDGDSERFRVVCSARLELHDGSEEDYEELHKAMEIQGFARTITSSDGITYHLPPAEYYSSTNLNRSEVLEKAQVAAKGTGKTFSAVTVESKGVSWYNLPKMNK